MTRIAVVGASGFVGSTLVERLLAGGRCEVRPLIHRAGSAWRLARLGIELKPVELLSRDALRTALEGCTHVVNCSRGPRTVMFDGLENLTEVCRSLGMQRLVHLSSVAVYGDPPPPESVHEDAPTNPVDGGYGWTKLRQDEIVQAACRRGLPSVVLCPPYIGGAYSMFILRLLWAMQEGRFALVDGGGLGCNLVDVQNLAQAIELGLFCEVGDGKRIFVTNDEPTTWRDIADALVPLVSGDGGVPSISEDEGRQLARAATAPPRSTLSTLGRVVSSQETKALLREVALARRLYGIAQATTRWLPGAMRERIDAAMRPPIRIERGTVSPDYDARLCGLQLRGVIHSCARARAVLGYRPEVSFARSMAVFRRWYEATHGWGSDFAALFQELNRTAPPPSAGE
jgi:nucleoside-diphosphate-sugar epimerase